MSQISPLAINMSMTLPKRLSLLAALLATLAVAGPGLAGPHKGVVGKMLPATPVAISGKLLTDEGQPAGDRQIHFENAVTGDAYLTRTGKDGSFSIAVPPASYNLREESGPIVAGDIQAWTGAVNLGTVSEPSTLEKFLEGEGVAPALIHNPAPITSNVRPGNPIVPGSPIPSPDPHQ